MPAERSYPVSWSLFQFLMSAPANREAMNKMIRAIQDQDPEAFDCAGQLEKTFPGGLVRMEKLWHEWIAKGAAAVEAQHRKQAR